MEHSSRYLQERDDFVSRCSQLLPWLTPARLTFLAFWADTDSFKDAEWTARAAQFTRPSYLRLPALRRLGRLQQFKKEPPWIERRIRKQSGTDERILYVPNVPLKQIHRFILRAHLRRLTPDRAAFGFEPGRSRREHAALHCNKYVVVRLDIRSFFPTIEASQLDSIFEECGFKTEFRTVLTHLVTYHQRLPQGAPTSPKLADLVARSLDRKLRRLAKDLRWTYSRYADDLSFSCKREISSDGIGDLMGAVGEVVRSEGFELNPSKTRVMKHFRRQLVAGAVVNNPAPTVPRERRRRVRAIIHNCEKNGLVAEARRYRRKLEDRDAQPAVRAGRHAGELKRSDRIWPYGKQHPFVPSRYTDPLIAYPQQDWPWVYDFWHYLAGLVGEIHSLDPPLGRELLGELKKLKLGHTEVKSALGPAETRIRDFWRAAGELVSEINAAASASHDSPRFLPGPSPTPAARKRVARDEQALVAFAIDLFKHLFDGADDKQLLFRLWREEGLLENLRFAVELRHKHTHSRDPGEQRQREGQKIINDGYHRLSGKKRPGTPKEWAALQRNLCDGVLKDLRDLRDWFSNAV